MPFEINQQTISVKCKPAAVAKPVFRIMPLTLATWFVTATHARPILKLLKQSPNPNYFQDGTGQPIILTGSHTWNTPQDWGTGGKTQPVDFDAGGKITVGDTTH